MLFSSFALTILVFESVATATPITPVARALPSGHPVLNNDDLPDTNYTLKANMWPSGFAVPSATLTALPSGYSVGPQAVYGPGGTTVASFAVAEISAVAILPENAASRSISSAAGVMVGLSLVAGVLAVLA